MFLTDKKQLGKIAASKDGLVLVWAAAGLAVGLVALVKSQADISKLAFIAGAMPVLVALLVQIIRSLSKRDLGLDVIAALAMAVAIAFGENLAANVVALMYAGGQLLESFASRKAAHAMTALMGRVSHTAMRYEKDGLAEVVISDVLTGDRLMIRRGEVVPVDGTVLSGHATLDESALTGEAVPKRRIVNDEVLSGTTSIGEVFDLRAVRPAAESTYAAVIRLVQAAQSSKAPMMRLADRYGLVFLAVTLVLSLAAWWLSGDPIRLLAVLVIATPCPLILAVPVAIISGISRSASQGCLVKDGGTLEALARVKVAILDKTGTLTHGRPMVTAIEAAGPISESEILRLAASLDQASNHAFASALISAAHDRGLILASPIDVREDPGAGIEGTLSPHRVVLGGRAFVESRIPAKDGAHADQNSLGVATISVAVDGRIAGTLMLSDQLRPEAREVLDALRRNGIRQIVLASGDSQAVVNCIGADLGIDTILGDLTPATKVAVVRSMQVFGPVLMVGDGINDAPALAAADVGVALGARGAVAASQTAGIVLLVDRLEPLGDALGIARRTIRIARQSVFAGLSLSLLGMLAAAFGYLPPLHGAVLQEGIDVAVILNALRALLPVRR